MSILSDVQELVKQSNLSMATIAGKADVSYATIEKLARASGITSANAEQIAAVFGKKFVLVDIVPEICEELLLQQGIYGFADSTTGENDDQ